MMVLRQTRKDAILIGTYPDDGSHVSAAATKVLAHPPTVRPGTYSYGDDGRRSCLLLAQQGPAGGIVCAAVLCDHCCLDPEATWIDVVSAPGLTAAHAGVGARLSRWRFDLARAHWVCGVLDDDGYPPSPYLFEGVYLDGEGPEVCDVILCQCWHPELRRLALGSRLGVPVRLWRLNEKHILATGMAAAERLQRALATIQ